MYETGGANGCLNEQAVDVSWNDKNVDILYNSVCCQIQTVCTVSGQVGGPSGLVDLIGTFLLSGYQSL